MPLIVKRKTLPNEIEKAKTKQWREIHALADSLTPKARKQFLQAVNGLRKMDLKKIQAAIESGNTQAVINLIAQEDLAARLKPMAESLQVAFSSAATIASDYLNKAGMQMSFDLLNQRAVQLLRNYKFGLIKRISDDTRAGIKQIVITAFESGGHPYTQAKYIRDLIGLLPRDAKAVDSYRDMLVNEGKELSVADSLAASYSDRLLTARANTIARTETMRASNMGQMETWRQASDEGLIDIKTARKIWVVTPDDVLCEYCAEVPDMNPEGVPIYGLFDTSLGESSEPPLHPNCRCAIVLSP